MENDQERVAAAAAIIASRCTKHWREYDNAEWIARAVLRESDRHSGHEVVIDVEPAGRLTFVIVPGVSDGE